MADKTFRLNVVSPEQELYSGEATFLIAQTTEGELGVLPGHAPLFGQLAPGGTVVVDESDGDRRALAVQGGFLSVTGSEVVVLADSAQFASDVDVAAEKSVLESAEEGSPEHLRARSRIRAVDALGSKSH